MVFLARSALLGTLLALAAGAASAEPFGYTVNSDGVSDASADRLLRINLSTGTVQEIGPLGSVFSDVEGLALDEQGNLWGVDDATKTVVRINTTSGAATAVGGSVANTRLPTGANQGQDPSLAFTCNGELLLVTQVARSLYRIQRDTGVAEPIGAAGALGVQITDLAVWGEEVYGLGVDGLYRIDPNQGTARLIGSYGGNVHFNQGGGLAFDTTGQLWAVADRRELSVNGQPSEVYRIDRETGRATFVAQSVIGLESLAIAPPQCRGTVQVTAIPSLDPRGLALLGLLVGLATLLVYRFGRD